MPQELSSVEDVATLIASTARRRQFLVDQQGRFLFVTGNNVYMRLGCPDASQAARLAEMMRAPPAPVFAAMNLPELPAFPSIRGKA